MRPLLRIIIILLFSINANAQWQYLYAPKIGPDSLYGTYDVFITSTGTVSFFGGDPCLAATYPGTEFWSGAGLPGGYIFTILKPVYRIYINFDVLNTGEYIQVYLNGSPYTIQPADVVSYTECNPSPGNPPCTLSGGLIWGPCCAGVYNGGDLIIADCKGINSFEVFCNGVIAGTSFHVAVDTLIPVYCVRDTNSSPGTIGATFRFSGANAYASLCSGSPLYMDAVGDSTGATYSWTGPGGFTSALKHLYFSSVTSANAGVYHTYKKVGGVVVDSVTDTIVVNQLPSITVSYNAPLCTGVATTLNLFASSTTPGVTYLWSGPASYTSTVQNPVITPIVTGVYTVTDSSSTTGCINSQFVNVVFTPTPPAPGITGISPYCTGEPFVPFTVTGSGLLWYPGATGGTGSSIAPVVNTSVAGTTTVWASQTVAGCESTTRGSFTTVVNTTPPAPVITGTNVYCQFDTYAPPTATGTGILWYTAPTGGAGTAGVPTISTTVPGSTTIYATQTITGCESPRAPFTITVHPKPVNPVVIANPSLYCPGQPFVPFSVISGVGLLWYKTLTGGTGTGVAPTLQTDTPGTYSVYVSQTVLGCESDRTIVTITVADNVKADFDYKIGYGCKADTVIFNNKSIQTTTYTWKFGDRYSSQLVNPTHVYLLQALDTVKLYASVSVCMDSSIQYIDLRHPIHSIFTTDTNLICQGKTITFTDDTSVGTKLSYLWEFGDNNAIHAPYTGKTATYQYFNAGTYKAYLVVTDFVPCTDTMFKTIQVDTISPMSVALTDTVICRGTYVTFTGKYASLGNIGVTWQGLTGGDSIKNQNPLVYGFDVPGIFTVKATALYRVCPDTSASRNITVVAQPSLDLGADLTICKGGQPITLADNINAGNSLASWEWSTGEKTSAITVVAPGVYTATVKVHGCYASASVTVSNDCYINVPNVFTPNGDGLNDYFYPHQYLSSGLTSFQISIFNRWGEMVFQSNSLDGRGWDGKLNDVPQPEGVYVYLIEATFKDGQHERHQGNVTLLR